MRRSNAPFATTVALGFARAHGLRTAESLNDIHEQVSGAEVQPSRPTRAVDETVAPNEFGSAKPTEIPSRVRAAEGMRPYWAVPVKSSKTWQPSTSCGHNSPWGSSMLSAAEPERSLSEFNTSVASIVMSTVQSP